MTVLAGGICQGASARIFFLLPMIILYHALDKNAIVMYNNKYTDRFSLILQIAIFA